MWTTKNGFIETSQNWNTLHHQPQEWEDRQWYVYRDHLTLPESVFQVNDNGHFTRHGCGGCCATTSSPKPFLFPNAFCTMPWVGRTSQHQKTHRACNNTQALIHTWLSLTHEGRVHVTDINCCWRPRHHIHFHTIQPSNPTLFSFIQPSLNTPWFEAIAPQSPPFSLETVWLAHCQLLRWQKPTNPMMKKQQTPNCGENKNRNNFFSLTEALRTERTNKKQTIKKGGGTECHRTRMEWGSFQNKKIQKQRYNQEEGPRKKTTRRPKRQHLKNAMLLVILMRWRRSQNVAHQIKRQKLMENKQKHHLKSLQKRTTRRTERGDPFFPLLMESHTLIWKVCVPSIYRLWQQTPDSFFTDARVFLSEEGEVVGYAMNRFGCKWLDLSGLSLTIQKTAWCDWWRDMCFAENEVTTEDIVGFGEKLKFNTTLTSLNLARHTQTNRTRQWNRTINNTWCHFAL